MAQSRYLFALSCFQMGLLTEAETALCPPNEPAAEVDSYKPLFQISIHFADFIVLSSPVILFVLAIGMLP